MKDKSMPNVTFKARGGLKRDGCPKINWPLMWKWLSLFFVILTLIIVLIQAVSNADALQRYVIQSEPTGDGAQFWGLFTIDSNNNRLLYELRYVNTTSTLVSIRVRGPIIAPTRNGAIAAYLCGGGLAPQPACNNAATGIVAEAIVKQIDDGHTSPQQDVRILATKIRKDPHLYYLEVETATHTYRSFFNGILGTP